MTPKHPATCRFVTDGVFEDLTSFSELERRIEALGDDSSKAVGDAFEVFVEAYLATQPLLQCVDCHPVGQVPLDDRRTLNLPNDTKGIDGIFRTRNGVVVPYQAKYRSRRPSLTFTEVSPFLAVTERATDRLLVTNCDRIAPDITVRDHLRTLRGTDFDELTAEDFEACLEWLRGKAFVRPTAEPRPDQIVAVQKVRDTLAELPRATVVMPCGTGKTLVQLWVAEAVGARSVLVLVPALSLIHQTLTEWSRHHRWGQRFRYLCVCSDPTVIAGVEDTLVTTQADLGFVVDTDPAVVRAFLAGEDDAVCVIFSTYQSARVVAQGVDGKALDLGIFDEAHKTAGPLGGMFGFALSDANLPIRRRAFFTATPRRRLPGRDRDGDFKVVSMDDESIYGPIAYAMSFAEAVAQKVICDYRVVLSVVDPDEISEAAIRHGVTLVKGDLQATEWVASQIAVQHAVTETGATKVITFHSRVAHAQFFASNTPRGIGQYLPGFIVEHVNGAQSVADRRDRLSGFKDRQRRLVTNARCLTEGVDLPAVDMVAFINPKKSKVDIVQAIGRAVRKPSDHPKDIGYVVVPVLLERADGQSLEEACQRTDWADVMDVLAALRDSDSRLADNFSAMSVARGGGGVFNPRALRERIQLVADRHVDLEVIQRALGNVIVDRLGVSWDEWYGQLVAYKAAHGDCHVPQHYAENRSLGEWCSTQRQLRKRGKLAAARFQRLEGLGFNWAPRAVAWETVFGNLVAYKSKHGDCHVSQYDTDYPGLGDWCGLQRVNRKNGRLGPEAIAKLDELGFAWQLRHDWETMFASLANYKAKHGDTNVPRGHPDDPQLSKWCSEQRQRKKRGNVPAERVARLEALGFLWDMKATRWEEGFARLAAYAAAHGNCDVPVVYAEDPLLGRWCQQQRSTSKKGALASKRAARLEGLGFQFSKQDAQWDLRFEQLAIFKAAEGHCNVPWSYSDEPALAEWCQRQRLSMFEDTLEPERAARLEALGLVAVRGKWNGMFARLVAYKAAHGDCDVPVPYPVDPSLARWCQAQRQDKRRGVLAADRMAQLGELGFIWELLDDWEAMFARLAAYKAAHGDCLVSRAYTDDRLLRRWCRMQQRDNTKGVLAADRTERLAELGFIWASQDWDVKFARLVAYKATHGDCNVPVAYPDDPSLGRWCQLQRRCQNEGVLAPEKTARLATIGFAWGARPLRANRVLELGLLKEPLDDWEAMFARLVAYKTIHGDCEVPIGYQDDPLLREWCEGQRKRKYKRALSSDRMVRLDKLRFVWEPWK